MDTLVDMYQSFTVEVTARGTTLHQLVFKNSLIGESREQNLITASKKTDTNTKYTLRPSVKCYSGNFIIQIHAQARRALLFLINRLLPWRPLILAVHSSVYSWKYCHRYNNFAGHAHGLSISNHLQKCLVPNFRHQWIHTYGCLWYINGCTALCTCTCTDVYVVRVYTCHDLEKAHMIMWIGTIRGLDREFMWLGCTRQWGMVPHNHRDQIWL